MINKWLLLGNIVLVVLLVVLIVGGCAPSNTAQITSLTNQVEANRVAIAQLQAQVSQQGQQIQALQGQLSAFQTSTQTALQAAVASLQVWAQQSFVAK